MFCKFQKLAKYIHRFKMIECPDANKVHEDGCCFLCNECTESFSSLAQLQFHIQDKHVNFMPPK